MKMKNNAFFNSIRKLLCSNYVAIDKFKVDRFFYYFTTFLISCGTSAILFTSVFLKTNDFSILWPTVIFVGLSFTVMIGLIPMLLTANTLARIDKLNVQSESMVKESPTAKGRILTIQLMIVIVLMLFANVYLDNIYDLLDWLKL